LEEAQEAAAGLREQLTDARKRLREVLDEEKELKKRRRATALALATVRLRRGRGCQWRVVREGGGRGHACVTALPM
jgi:hypothetical protein